MSVDDEWFKEFLEERSDDLGRGDLMGYAAAAAARELIENWSDCWSEGYWFKSDRSNAITADMVQDIDETIEVLEQWKMELKKRRIE